MNGQYIIGIDFGTLSARASVFRVGSQETLSAVVFNYPSQVMCNGIFKGCACADPEDYRNALRFLLREIQEQNNLTDADISAVGIDCTACSILPVTKDFSPLSSADEFRNDPFAYIRLWKDHSAEKEAKEITSLAIKGNEDWLNYCGRSVSAEWLLPKLLHVYRLAPELCKKDILFMETGDWLTALLTGKNVRSSSAAGFVGNRMEASDFPSDSFLEALAPGFSSFIHKVTDGEYLPVGSKAGEITAEAAREFDLKKGTTVCVFNVDAQAAFPASSVSGNDVLAVMGTSTVYLMTGAEKKSIPGISCTVKDGILPGCYGYSAGQSCSGDMLEWYVRNAVPADTIKEAENVSLDIHGYLSEKACDLSPGGTGLIALDWLGGNRAILRDMDLSGMIIGMTRETKPWHIYRALAESTAFGARIILERCGEYGIGTGTVYMSGGIPRKNPMIMQIYADVLDREIVVLGKSTGPALGSAITALFAAGSFSSIADASAALICEDKLRYYPEDKNKIIYDELYSEYRRLHDYFGQGQNDIMKKLRTIQEQSENDK